MLLRHSPQDWRLIFPYRLTKNRTVSFPTSLTRNRLVWPHSAEPLSCAGFQHRFPAAAGRLMLFRLVLRLSAAILLTVGVARADEPAPENERRLSELVESIVRAAVPRTFEDVRHWNKHEKVFAGVKVKTDGLNVRISKRTKVVRHGFWRRYTVTLIDPERTLKVRISDVQSLGGGLWTFTVTADVRANVLVRFEHWNLGVKLFNTSSEANASLRLRSDCSLKVAVESDDKTGPVVVFTPDVKTVKLSLPNLDVKKFGELRGDVATDLFDGLENVIEDLLETQEGNVRKQARKEIARHQDDLRIPLGRFVTSHWASLWTLP